jgi:hypothetical protein
MNQETTDLLFRRICARAGIPFELDELDELDESAASPVPIVTGKIIPFPRSAMRQEQERAYPNE